MGTAAEVAVPPGTAPAAVEAAFSALGEVDDEMSLWKDTPLARLNAAGRGQATPALLGVVRHALDVCAASDGAFDITVEPLVRAAGALGGRPRQLSPRARARLAARVGAGHVHLEAEGVLRMSGGARLDLGGIAKGYAVDRALERLRSGGVEQAVVDLGQSSVGVLGRERIAVRDPFRPDAVLAELTLADASLATSGNAERGAHVIDPRTGLLVTRAGSVTVVAASGMEADALSTAAWVLGPERGLELVARRGAQGLFVTGEAGAVLILTTPGFAARFALRVAPGVTQRD